MLVVLERDLVVPSEGSALPPSLKAVGPCNGHTSPHMQPLSYLHTVYKKQFKQLHPFKIIQDTARSEVVERSEDVLLCIAKGMGAPVCSKQLQHCNPCVSCSKQQLLP